MTYLFFFALTCRRVSREARSPWANRQSRACASFWSYNDSSSMAGWLAVWDCFQVSWSKWSWMWSNRTWSGFAFRKTCKWPCWSWGMTPKERQQLADLACWGHSSLSATHSSLSCTHIGSVSWRWLLINTAQEGRMTARVLQYLQQ